MASSGWNRRRHILVLLVIVAALLAAAHISISSVPARGSSYPSKTNTTAESEIFIDTTPPTVSVTTPSAGTTYTTDTMPDTFSGTVKDNDNGVGVESNSTTFILRRGSDFKYWDGDSWESTSGWSPQWGDSWESTLAWLSTSHESTYCIVYSNGTPVGGCGGAEVIWTDSIDLPT